jgi:uncharacterized Tic20 family protein
MTDTQLLAGPPRRHDETGGPGQPARQPPIGNSDLAADLPPDLRVSDAEREPVIEQLRQAFAEGRLRPKEFEQRLTQALTAPTHADLAPVLVGLPVPRPARAVPSAPSAAAPVPAVVPPPEERTAAVAAHLLGAVTSFVGPLIMVVAARNSPTGFAREQAIEALNFQLSLLLITLVTLGIGGVVYAVAWIFSIVAAVSAGSGQRYRYPLTWRLVR